MTQIKNGRAYPKALKLAALKASKLKANKKRTTAQVAGDFNIHKATLATWKRVAGIAAPQPVGLATYQAAQAAAKQYNTPTVNADGTITYQGRTFR